MSKTTFVRRDGRRPAALLSVAALAATGLLASALPAGAAITSGGAVTTGLAGHFRDAQGIAVVQCTNAAHCAPVDTAADPLAGPYYYSAEASQGSFLAAYELASEAVVDEATGQETGDFAVANSAVFKADGLLPNRKFVIKDPWGTHTCVSNGDGELDNKNCLFEGGGEAATPIGSGPVKTFLRQVNAPANFLGSLEGLGRVTGSPTGFNRVTVTGPNVNISINRFAVNGQMRANTAMTTVGMQSLKLGSITKARPSVATIPVSSFGTAAARFNVTKSGPNAAAFAVQNTCTSVAANAAPCNIKVTYTPRANRNASAVLTVNDNGLAAPRQVKLTGIAQDTRAPKVVSSNPAKRASNVRPGKSLKVQFSEAVRGAKSGLSLVDASGDKVAARVSQVRRSNTYVINPGSSLDRDASYAVMVNGSRKGLRDLAGNAARDAQVKFSTR
jgi:hypothetical protein